MNGAMVWIESISETKSGNRSAVAVSMGTYHLTRFAVSLLLASPWPFLFALVTESFSQMMPTVWATLGSGFILLLTQQAFDGMGCFLAEVAGPTNTPRAVCLGTIVSQLLVIAGEPPSRFHFITMIQAKYFVLLDLSLQVVSIGQCQPSSRPSVQSVTHLLLFLK